VISIIDDGLERLKLFTKLRDLKILVAGGDGTVGSCINYLRSGELEDWKVNQPPVAILPLGTGNDLSRALGWVFAIIQTREDPLKV
jgi:diacylglycerol kinase (ATP)